MEAGVHPGPGSSHLRWHWPEVRLERVALGTSPTPVRAVEMAGISRDVDLWVKSEDAYGDGAWGGNKVRKLEWIIPEARRRGVRSIFTVGGIGTHWGLACARYGADFGLRTILGVLDQPEDDHVRQQWARVQESPAVIHRFPDAVALRRAAPGLMLSHAFDRGTRGLLPRFPWFVPAGGSNVFGALGYVEAAFELAAQVAGGELPEPATLVVPTGSGGTVAGLLLGLRMSGLRSRVLAVVVNDSLPLAAADLVALANATGRLLRQRGGADVPTVSVDDLDVRGDWLGAGYGDPTPESMRMVAAASEVGFALEPVYTGKALAAIAAIGTELPGPLLWFNTHGPR